MTLVLLFIVLLVGTEAARIASTEGARARRDSHKDASKDDLFFDSDLATKYNLSDNEGAYQGWDEGKYGARSCDEAEVAQFEKLFKVTLPTNSDLFVEYSDAPQADLPSRHRSIWSSKIRSGSVLFLYPDQDKNDAYSITAHECYRLLSWAHHYRSVRLIHVSSVPEAMEILNLYPVGSINHLVVGGHGSRTSSTFNSFTSDGKLGTYDAHAMKFWMLASSKLAPQARVFMDSCLNAKDNTMDEMGNQLNFISRMLPTHRVFASQISLSRHETVITNFENYHVLIRSHNDPEGEKRDSVRNWVIQGNCKDAPHNWKDSNGNDCEAFADKGLCYAEGKDKAAAAQACCKCGGGQLQSTHSGTCPASSVAVGAGQCKCSSPTARCYQSDGQPCPTQFLATCVDCHCVEQDSCPAWSYFKEPIYGNCYCREDSICYDEGSVGCPLHDGSRSTGRMFSTGCKTCACKTVPSKRDFVSCSGRFRCKCMEGASCYKGDHKGQCPDPGLWGKGQVAQTSSEFFDARCDGCECRKTCPGDAESVAARDGLCECGSSDLVKCFQGNSTSPGCTFGYYENNDDSHDIKCKDCACRYTGPYKVGQKVQVSSDPEEKKVWRNGVVTSVRGGTVKVEPTHWGASYEFPHIRPA